MIARILSVALCLSGASSAATICACSQLATLDSDSALNFIVPEGYQEFVVLSSSAESIPTAYLYWDGGVLHFGTTLTGHAADGVMLSLLGDSGEWTFLEIDLNSAFGDGSTVTYFDSYEPVATYEFLALFGADKKFHAEISHADGAVTSLVTANSIPEPSSASFLSIGGIGLWGRNRKGRTRRAS